MNLALHQLAADLARRLEQRGAALHEISVTIQFKRSQTQTERLHLLQPVASAQGIAATVQTLIARMDLGFQIADNGITSIDLEVDASGLGEAAPAGTVHATNPRGRSSSTSRRSWQCSATATTSTEAVTADRGAILPERRFRLQRVDAS